MAATTTEKLTEIVENEGYDALFNYLIAEMESQSEASEGPAEMRCYQNVANLVRVTKWACEQAE